MENLEGMQYLLVDFKHVLSINENVCHLILQLMNKLAEVGKRVLFVRTAHLPLLRRFMR